MNNNYNTQPNLDGEIERMKSLMGYGLNENKNTGNANVAFHQVGPDGKTYGIIKECNKFYIKVAPKKDGEILAEDYDYIGGFMNKKEYEYPTYTIASKQFGLKMASLNEAYASKNKPVILEKPMESSEWQVNETKEMRSEINRFNQLMNNVDYILSEGKEHEGKALQLGSNDVDEEGGNAYQEKPMSEKHVNGMKENETDPKNADETYSEKPMSTDEVNSMKETSKDPKSADRTYTKKAPKTMKLTNEQMEKVLAWSNDKNYLDTTKGTEIGHDGDPYTETPDITNEAVYNSEDMSQHIGDAKGYMKPFNDKVNEKVEIDSETGLPTEENPGQLIVDDNLMPDNNEVAKTDDFQDDVPFEDFENNFEYDSDYGYDYETRDDLDYVLEKVVSNTLKKILKENEEAHCGEEECLNDAMRMFKNANRSNYFDIEKAFLDKWEQTDCDAYHVLQFVRYKYGLDNIKHGHLGTQNMNEDKLDVFGKHPAYQKSPMTLPANFEPSKFGHEWDDESAKGEQPYGTKIGHGGDPYTEKIIDMLTDSVVDKLVSNISGKKKV